MLAISTPWAAFSRLISSFSSCNYRLWVRVRVRVRIRVRIRFRTRVEVWN